MESLQRSQTTQSLKSLGIHIDNDVVLWGRGVIILGSPN